MMDKYKEKIHKTKEYERRRKEPIAFADKRMEVEEKNRDKQ